MVGAMADSGNADHRFGEKRPRAPQHDGTVRLLGFARTYRIIGLTRFLSIRQSKRGRLKNPIFRRPLLVFRILFCPSSPRAKKHEADGNGRATGATTKHQPSEHFSDGLLSLLRRITSRHRLIYHVFVFQRLIPLVQHVLGGIVFRVQRFQPIFQLVFAVLVAHLVVAAVFLVQGVTLLLVVKRGLGVLVGEVVGVDFVQRGSQSFFKVEFGAVESWLGRFCLSISWSAS